ncbi:MAG: 5-oxoprolinase subunit PxpB [Betaproteobacteria bacterium]|jgi:inhibitor of KinA|nr:5-oxoprolinase subunit PxpB [Rhodocyclaceae bacterium]MCA3135375.1 5-oxoprolinase subunit PxpB [Rhodocyclaceae bacterium]MCA3140716.1 5-oxoprolinase subunit PxpB [Rhodocyclaceae bacterium]MCA3146249.1 5-oxoprolinase subunit PxpB [Rhodocyclaceae bacterium]MCE2897693.1 5-oxoprolinase subunit PxpB [Betaproteobacteria bacterium]
MVASAQIRFAAMGDSALVVEFGQRVDALVNRRVQAAAEYLLAHPLAGVTDVVPAYAALTVHFDPLDVLRRHPGHQAFDTLREAVAAALARAPAAPRRKPRSHEIPVCYGGSHGDDLAAVAEHHGLEPEDVIRLHCAPTYEVHLLGFVPGFAYLGGLDLRIATPRRDVPRKVIAAGSVAIGGEQTGIYPSATPGGWNLIGRTPWWLFRPEADPPNRLAPGDRVKFVAIGVGEFETLLKAAN